MPQRLSTRSAAEPGLRPRQPAAGQPTAEVHTRTLEALAPPSLLVDERWNVLNLSESAARFLQQRGGPLARTVTDLARPELRDELHAVLHRAFEQSGQHLSAFVPVSFNGTPRQVAVLAQARRDTDAGQPRALVTFLEAGEAAAEDLAADEEPGDAQMRSLRERLHRAEERIRTMADDRHLAHEDLRAANEELQSLNEEYRSTTEELETSKEELQSINEELQTVNHELRDKLEQISRAHNDLENLMAATDIATLFLDRSLRIKRFTPQLTEIFSVRSSDEGRPIRDFTHHLDYQALEADARRVLADLAPIERETMSADGRTFITRLRPYRTAEDRIDGVVVTFVDVTELKRAQHVLSESEERFRALVEASAQLVWTADAHGQVVEGSRSWTSYTGQDFAEQQGSGWLDTVHPDDRAAAETAWRQALETQTPFVGEFRIHHAPSGSHRWTSVRAVPLRRPDDAVRGWVALGIDVNERREAVEALRHEDQRKDEFLAILGHELRNPLAAIRNCIEVLAARKGEDAFADTAWGVVDRQSRHIERLLGDLLDVTRIKRGKLHLNRATVDLGRCILDAVESLRTRAEAKQLEVSLDLFAEPVYIHADAERLVQIIDNLLRNAIDYTAPGGHIHVSTSRHHDRASVSVRDSGIGISPDDVKRIFEPYYQADQERQTYGLGLGLALVKELVDMHGGTIEARSEGLGSGAEFRLSLPLAADPPPSEQKTRLDALPRRRVLVVDDASDVAEAFAAVLESLGQDVRLTCGAESALDVARELEPQVAFIDLSMPGIDGWEVARRLRAEFPPGKLTLVAVSGFGKGRAFIRDGEFDHHLLKPAATAQVAALLKSLANRP